MEPCAGGTRKLQAPALCGTTATRLPECPKVLMPVVPLGRKLGDPCQLSLQDLHLLSNPRDRVSQESHQGGTGQDTENKDRTRGRRQRRKEDSVKGKSGWRQIPERSGQK